jgi:hypothetical protein
VQVTPPTTETVVTRRGCLAAGLVKVKGGDGDAGHSGGGGMADVAMRVMGGAKDDDDDSDAGGALASSSDEEGGGLTAGGSRDGARGGLDPSVDAMVI